jgi:hypothetical protein
MADGRPSIHFPDRRPRFSRGRKIWRPATRLTVLGAADTFWAFRDLRVRTIG